MIKLLSFLFVFGYPIGIMILSFYFTFYFIMSLFAPVTNNLYKKLDE